MNNPATIGVLIRFADSESTLPRVLAALQRQTVQPQHILGIASRSTDRSCQLMSEAGAEVIEWTAPYAHSQVLNFGLCHLPADLVLILSSHTVLESPDTLGKMATCFQGDRVACASLKWDNDPFYSDCVTWEELQVKGLRFGSIYSNSMGMIRRALWEQVPFDETLPTGEDYAWALEQLRRGHICRRLDHPFSYQRGGPSRDRAFARLVFRLGRRFGLRVRWLGVRGALKEIASGKDSEATRDRLMAWLASRLAPG